MQIFLTGATGFVGRALVARLLADGHTLSAWVRSPARAAEQLGARVELIDATGGDAAMLPAIARADAIVNLAGEPVVGKRWTAARKQAMWTSRVDTTRAITRAIVACAARAPRSRVFVSASASGYYGDTGDAPVDEDSPRGAGFLADLCVAWEQEACAAAGFDTRVCRVRLGLVLGRDGGVLATMLPLFRLGLGGRLGDGAQYFPWVHLGDLVGILATAVVDPAFTGPVNAVAPGAVTNREFTKALGRALHRPTILPAPAFGLKLAFGESASALLGGQRVAPKRTCALGYRFAFPELHAALAYLLG
jgi:uncharacterized protein